MQTESRTSGGASRRRRASRPALLVLLAAGLFGAMANPASGSLPALEDHRPRTALVLSGGGARGAAHVGLLQVLEEQQVAVDCVVGTSMGAIVGGLYAAGWTPAELEGHLRDTDWRDVFDDAPPRKRTSFRRKQDDFLPLFPIELGVSRRGLRAPAGLIAGRKLGFLLRRLTLPAATLDDFDRLPLPFRAIAADLDSGEMVVLEGGSLAEALRASMSIPGAFTPVEIDGRTLVDGGIVRNLPVDVARELCADRPGDRVLAIDIGTPPRSLKGTESFFTVMFQTFSVINKRNVEASRDQIRPNDLLLSPDLGDISAASFQRVGEAIALGRRAAQENRLDLQPFAVSEDRFEQFEQRRQQQRAVPDPLLAEVVVRGAERVAARQITARLRTQPGQLLNFEQLGRDLSRIYQLEEFEQVDFRFEALPAGTRLVIEVEERQWAPAGYLQPGLQLEANLEGESEFLAIANYRRTQINRLGAEWKLLTTLGDQERIFSEFFQPLDYRGFTFIAPFVQWLEDELVEPTGELGGIDFDQFDIGVDVGVQFGNYGEIRFGVQSGRVRGNSSRIRNLVEADTGGIGAELTFDRLDEIEFPRSGSLARFEVFRSDASLGADDEFDLVEGQLFGAASRGRTTFFGGAAYGSALSTELPDYAELDLGGFFNLSGLRPQALRGDALALASVGVYREMRPKLYAGIALEAGNTWDDASDLDLGDLVYSALAYIGRKTFIGPVYLGYAQTDQGDDSFYFFLGRTFD
ncbi:MAG: patatin-like phospholipase family protein [Acidobacteriota bacterium]